MSRLGPIEERLEAALRYGVVNGNAMERAVLECQIREAIDVIRQFRYEVAQEAEHAAR